ncbi:hypothetical protein M9H77_31608 [Catharanthus roseus]|uniref:Uncharacterized protein n=1 Tax=Catharanthus roseus TaxID=4058 RepID=A0ACC0A4G7_CATRO|nr:hypothetical protein M9H77_31608 [Catharanthus roseus]
MMEFQIGDKVEVIGNDKGFEGSYYTAKVISKKNAYRYKVEYETLLNEDQFEPLKEVVNSNYLRPMPPNVPEICYSLDEWVDAYENDGWWFGLIDGKFGSDYFVYFPTTQEEKPFPLDKLRIHHEWSNSKRKWEPCEVYQQRIENTRNFSRGGNNASGSNNDNLSF